MPLWIIILLVIFGVLASLVAGIVLAFKLLRLCLEKAVDILNGRK